MPTRTIGDLDCKRALGAIVSPHPELKLAAIYAPPDDGAMFRISKIFGVVAVSRVLLLQAALSTSVSCMCSPIYRRALGRFVCAALRGRRLCLCMPCMYRSYSSMKLEQLLCRGSGVFGVLE